MQYLLHKVAQLFYALLASHVLPVASPVGCRSQLESEVLHKSKDICTMKSPTQTDRKTNGHVEQRINEHISANQGSGAEQSIIA